MRAVAIAVAIAFPRLTVRATDNIQVAVRTAARIDDCDGEIPGIRCELWAELCIDAVDAGRQRLSHRLHRAVIRHECDAGIALNIVQPCLRDRRCISLQRTVIAVRNCGAVQPRVLSGNAVYIALVVMEYDDDLASTL